MFNLHPYTAEQEQEQENVFQDPGKFLQQMQEQQQQQQEEEHQPGAGPVRIILRLTDLIGSTTIQVTSLEL